MDDDTRRAAVKTRLENGWKAVRDEATGSIINHSGYNLTSTPHGYAGFPQYVEELCGSDLDNMEWVAQMIEAAVAEGQQLYEMNQIPTTDPKCFSRPIIKLDTGCRVSYRFISRGNREVDCSGGAPDT